MALLFALSNNNEFEHYAQGNFQAKREENHKKNRFGDHFFSWEPRKIQLFKELRKTKKECRFFLGEMQ